MHTNANLKNRIYDEVYQAKFRIRFWRNIVVYHQFILYFFFNKWWYKPFIISKCTSLADQVMDSSGTWLRHVRRKLSLVSMGGWAEGQASADPGARTPIGASGISIIWIKVRKFPFIMWAYLGPKRVLYCSKRWSDPN